MLKFKVFAEIYEIWSNIRTAESFKKKNATDKKLISPAKYLKIVEVGNISGDTIYSRLK